ncbi:hypothetical protein MUK42_08436, partial [Musa troglodytarum]
ENRKEYIILPAILVGFWGRRDTEGAAQRRAGAQDEDRGRCRCWRSCCGRGRTSPCTTPVSFAPSRSTPRSPFSFVSIVSYCSR